MEDVRSEAGLVSLEVAGAGGSCSTPQFTGTVMASDAEVTNGFVKNGTSLPYVIETNKSGNRKRSSKILPVCGICGKKFVCVTTMKRHLVTHTGERPFNCKVCGKQYTQKGNLRVHERTHRNDRPFECNICHQKFYRKEPMQKHQWRQHGIGHYKSRPNGPEGSSIGIIGAESVLYNSLVERIKTGPEDHGVMASEPPMFETFPDPDVPEPASHTEIENFSEEEDDTASTHSISRVVNKYINDNNEVEDEDHDDPKKSLEMLKYSFSSSEQTNVLSTAEFENNNEAAADTDNLVKPMKLKMKLAQAYLKEVKEEREREERDGRSCEGRDSFDTSGALGHLEENLGDITLSRSIGVEVVSPVTKEVTSATVTKEVVKEKECVECVCKACGSKCSVSDPYNFSCQHCNVKYTSLPTHMIADPLQCIGCLQIFEHKPAMKEHQSSNDKERPFVCCKCGYEFKQKAHLQKHQWRIHRRKLEPDPNVKEAEAILKAVNEMSTSGGQEMSMKQIIDRGLVEDGIKKEAPAVAEIKVGNLESFEGSAPLDLSPCKMYGSANSITQWVQQVETARTPIIPDISILRKPLDVAFKAQLPTEPLQLSQLQPTGLLPSNDRVSVTIQLLEPPKPQKFQHFAVKSKPAPPENNWRSASNPKDDNPLLNQKLIVEEVLPSSPTTSIIYTSSTPVDRVYKRARIENNGLLPSNPTHLQQTSSFSPSNTQLHPADLSINQTLDFSPPSPPLNLSSKRVESEDLPFDYTITRSELIKGQLRRIRNQDERCGI